MTPLGRTRSDGRIWVDGIQKGEVYLVLVPPKDCRGSEQTHDVETPWLVVSVDAIHRHLPILLAAPLTTQLEKGQALRNARISLQRESWVKGKEMDKDSLVLTEQVRVLAHERLKKGPIARLSSSSISAVDAGLAYVLGIP